MMLNAESKSYRFVVHERMSVTDVPVELQHIKSIRIIPGLSLMVRA